METEIRHLFDDHRLRNELSAWVAKATWKGTELHATIAAFCDQEIERNVREALGKVEMAAHPEIGRPLVEGEEAALGWGWSLACDWLRQRIDEVLKEYHV